MDNNSPYGEFHVPKLYDGFGCSLAVLVVLILLKQFKLKIVASNIGCGIHGLIVYNLLD